MGNSFNADIYANINFSVISVILCYQWFAQLYHGNRVNILYRPLSAELNNVWKIVSSNSYLLKGHKLYKQLFVV